MKLVVAGCRWYRNRHDVFEALDRIHAEGSLTEIVSGMARGVDTLAVEWAASRGVPVTAFPADWSLHGRRAGPLRNLKMAAYGDALLAFWDGESRGTNHMIEVMRKKNNPTSVVMITKCPTCDGVGSYPPPTRQVCPDCKGTGSIP